MRGLGLIVGFLLGNKETRDWIFNQFNQASRSIDEQIKKTELGKIFSQTQVAETEDKKQKNVVNKPDHRKTEIYNAQENQETD